jgi:hypothetical protein
MSLAQAQSDLSAARGYLIAEDYASALRYVTAAQILLAGIPNTTHDSRSIELREMAAGLLTEIRKQQAAASVAANGIRRSKVTYASTTD